MSGPVNENDPLRQLDAAIADDNMSRAHGLVFEMTRGGHDLALAYAATARCFASGDKILRSVGLRALGNIARVFDTLDESYKEVIEEGLADPDHRMRWSAELTAMDLYSFLHWQFRNWVPKEPPEPPEMRFEDVTYDHLGRPMTPGNVLVTEHKLNSRTKNDNWRIAIGLPPLEGRIRRKKPQAGP